jgi:hypothetical protein
MGGFDMRKALMGILVAGIFVGSYATDARVVSMGRHDAFFMDEVSVFRNPANINIYPTWFMVHLVGSCLMILWKAL